MQARHIILIFAFLSLPAAAQHTKIAPDLSLDDPSQVRDVIVRYKVKTTERHTGSVKARGGRVRNTIDAKSIHARMRGAAIRDLANDADVEYIAPDREVSAVKYSGGPDYGWMTVLGVADPDVPLPYDGRGIAVAVLDSGIEDADDLKERGKSRIVYKASFVPGDSKTGDNYGHGQHVAGLIAGNGKKSEGKSSKYVINGIAPNANIVSLRVLDDSGRGTDSAVINAINEAIRLKSKYNIRVMNLSLGRPVRESAARDPLCLAVQRAWTAGIVVVVAAGNEGRNNSRGNNGYGTIHTPGNSPFAITVGAANTRGTLSRADDKITSFSSKGPTAIDHYVKPDLVAPGNQVISLAHVGSFFMKNYPDNMVPKSVYMENGNSSAPDYFQLSGTSMATPMVSGAAALLLQKEPSLTPDQVKARLMKTAWKSFAPRATSTVPGTGVTFQLEHDIFTVGAGYLDVIAALASSEVAPAGRSARSPQATYSDGVTRLVPGTSVLWGDSVAWATTSVWGRSVLWGDNVIWGDNVLWGDSVLWGDNVIWGDSVLWGDGNVKAESLSILLNGEN